MKKDTSYLEEQNRRKRKVFVTWYQEKFIECFQKVSAAIGPVYRRLTAQNGADGGSAYLDLEAFLRVLHRRHNEMDTFRPRKFPDLTPFIH